MQSIKLKGVGDLKNAWTSDMKMQNLKLDLLVFSLALVQHFLTTLPSFGMVMYLLCHYMLEVYDLLFYFDFTGVTVTYCYVSQRF